VRQLPFQPARSLNSATRLVSVTSQGAPTLPSRARPAVRADDDERLVDRAVVAVAVDQDLGAAGDRAQQPDRPAVGVGRGQREAPAGRPKRRVSSAPTPRRPRWAAWCVAPPRSASRRVTAATTGAGECPAIAPVSPRQKSTYSWPSMSVTGRRGRCRGTPGSRRRSCSSRSSAPGRTGARRARRRRLRARVASLRAPGPEREGTFAVVRSRERQPLSQGETAIAGPDWAVS
jgi:hypothetical protein